MNVHKITKLLARRQDVLAQLYKLEEGGAADERSQLQIADLDSESEALLSQITELAAVKTDISVAQELLPEVSLHRYVGAELAGIPLDGAELELNQELGLPVRDMRGLAVPLAALAPRKSIHLTDVSTVLPDGDFRTEFRDPIVPFLASAVHEFLGIETVPCTPGQQRIPIIDSVPTPTAVAKGGNVDAAAASVRSVKFDPHEIRAVIRFSNRELDNWGADFEVIMREEMTRQTVARIDHLVLNGAGASNEPTGILKSFKGTGVPADPTAAATFSSFVQAVTDHVDGKYAQTEEDMRLVLGAKSWSRGRAQTASDNGAVDALGKLVGIGVRARSFNQVPAPASNIQQAVLALSGEAALTSFWAGIWNRAYIVVDPYTEAKAGMRRIAVTSHFSCGPLRGPSDRSTNSDLGGGIELLKYKVA